MKNIEEKVYRIICENCGDVFEKPRSCEDCMDDENMDALREYELKVATGEIKDSLSLYSLYRKE
jgi:uncharacterized OB-fold protein